MNTTRRRHLLARLIGMSLAAALLASGCGAGDPAAPPSAPPTASSPSPTTPSATRTTPIPTRTAPSPTTAPPPPTSTTTAPAQCSVGALAGADLERLATSRKVVALTFDAGASNAGAGRILDTLAAEGVPATFFLTGRFAQTYPELTAAIGARYPIGNHTQTHPDLTTLAASAVVDELRAARSAIRTYAGVESRPLFRFPFGARNSTVIDLVNDECYVAYRWTVDTLGWQGTSGGMTATTVHDRVLSTLHPGQIVLMHLGAHPQDGSTLDADALPEIIESIRAAGYEFVTLPR